MRLANGTTIGPYEIVSSLGAGGMGEVYRARDSKLKRDVALKVLPPDVAGDPDRLARFQREAQVLASLNHPHIAQIYGVEESAPGDAATGSRTTALVMELVEGEDLEQRIKHGALAVEEALLIAKQIAEALEAAHEQTVVHRDLKPANIKVRSDGTVKVLDFGLAKAIETMGDAGRRADAATSPTLTSPAMTLHGMILGTAAYMAPEQAKGKPVDKRADIWAFGCVCYEMLTGQRAFEGEDMTETLAAVVTKEPDWTRLPATTPLGIARLLRRCLVKDRRNRLPDIAAARLDLDEALSGAVETGPISRAVTERETWLGRGMWALLGAGIGALAIGAYALAGRDSAPPRISRVTIVPPADLPLLLGQPTPDVTISTDGRRVIYQSRRSDPDGVRLSAGQLASRALDAFESTPLPNLGLFPIMPFVSSDNAWIGFQTTAGAQLAPVLAKAPAAGGPMVIVCSLAGLGEIRGASWDNEDIVFATNQTSTGLFRVAAAGGTPESITKPSGEQGERDHLWPETLPGNAGVLFAIARGDSRFDVAVLPSGSNTWRTIIPGGSAARYLPGGHVIYAAGGILYGVGFDLGKLQVTTAPVRLLEGVLTKETGAADFAVSSNGTLAFVPSGQRYTTSRLLWLLRDGSTAVLPIEPRAYQRVRLSPDGGRIAVSLEERGAMSIWVYDLSRDTFTRVTPRGESVAYPLWSADGRRLAFWSQTQKGIFTMPADGSADPVRLTQLEAGAQVPDAWSVDGGTLAFVQDQPGINLFLVPVNSPHEIRPLTTSQGVNVEATFSPDGKWVAHVAFDGGAAELVVGPVASPERRWPIVSNVRYPVWDPGGRALLFHDGKAIQRIAIDPGTGRPSGKATKVVDLPARLNGLRPLNPSPDGNRFLMLERVDSEDVPSDIRVVLNWIEEVRAKMAQAAPAAAQ